MLWNREGRLGRWEGLSSASEEWRFAARKVKAQGGAAGGKRREEGGKVEEGRATPVVEL